MRGVGGGYSCSTLSAAVHGSFWLLMLSTPVKSNSHPYTEAYLAPTVSENQTVIEKASCWQGVCRESPEIATSATLRL